MLYCLQTFTISYIAARLYCDILYNDLDLGCSSQGQILTYGNWTQWIVLCTLPGPKEACTKNLGVWLVLMPLISNQGHRTCEPMLALPFLSMFYKPLCECFIINSRGSFTMTKEHNCAFLSFIINDCRLRSYLNRHF